LLGIAAFLLGIGVGSLVMKVVLHWVALLLAALGRDIGSSAPQRLSTAKWPFIFVVVHPVPWALLLGLPYGIHFLVRNPPAPGWIAFLGGVTFAIVAIPIASFIMLRNYRSKAAAASAAATGEDNVD
jgi:hypothetical protein